MSDLIAWAFEKWPFGIAVLVMVGFLYYGMIFEGGPAFIRPASAQSVQQQIAAAKNEVAAQVAGVQRQVKDISDKQDAADRRDYEDRVERLEQQLLFWRQQNCKSKGKAKNDAWDSMSKLKERYYILTDPHRTWEMPTCSDIGE